mmetsp:Transcript_34374/g.88907  ORF Transcript_34374/g.88907 Transcript_34374/m.88907 type:complete len:274 (+) Transcript_34374:456-1277(+)
MFSMLFASAIPSPLLGSSAFFPSSVSSLLSSSLLLASFTSTLLSLSTSATSSSATSSLLTTPCSPSNPACSPPCILFSTSSASVLSPRSSTSLDDNDPARERARDVGALSATLSFSLSFPFEPFAFRENIRLNRDHLVFKKLGCCAFGCTGGVELGLAELEVTRAGLAILIAPFPSLISPLSSTFTSSPSVSSFFSCCSASPTATPTTLALAAVAILPATSANLFPFSLTEKGIGFPFSLSLASAVSKSSSKNVPFANAIVTKMNRRWRNETR